MTYLTGFHAIEERIKSGSSCGPLFVAKAGPRAKEIVTLAVNNKIRLERTGTFDLDGIAPDNRGIALQVEDDGGNNSVSLENPDLYQAVTEMRSMLSQKFRQTAMGNELRKEIQRPVPLLFLTHHLGCNDEKLRQMNFIEDSLLVSGTVAYV